MFAQDPASKEGKLLPVRVRECEPDRLLRAIVNIILVTLDEAAAKQALLDGVQQGRAKPKVKPGFPNAPARTIASEPRFPGGMPAIWNVPHIRNRNFTGREDELAELRDSLNAGETAALVQARAISGLGGVGKTQTAVEYAYRNAGDYDYVWWIRSEDPVTLASDYASLAAELDLSEKAETEQRVVVEAVKKWLRQNRGWLLTFDNAKDAESVRDYIPSGSRGHIIITSLDPNWADVAESLSITPLPLDKAIEFLLKRTNRQDEATAIALAGTLGCLPLALEQASAYIETSGCTMAHYLKLFENRQRDLMQRGKPSAKDPNTVATIWSISIQNVEQENTAATELMRLCAFFAPHDIPVKLITEGAKKLPESRAAVATDSILLDESLAALRKYSLVKVEDAKLSIHRLVQAVIRHAMDEEGFKQWAGVAVHLVNASFPENSDDVRTWPVCASQLPRASVALSHAEAIEFASNETARLLNRVGLYLNTRAENAQAKKMYERAIKISVAILGADHPDVARDLNNLSKVLRMQGDLDGAKARAERALAIDEAVLGTDHQNVARDLDNLGLVLREQGDLDGAKARAERALAIDEAVFGTDHQNVARDLNNLSKVLRMQGDLDGAKARAERALAIDEAALGTDHQNVARDLDNMGLVLREQGDLAGAKALFERALAIDKAVLGLGHPNVGRDLDNLGDLMREQGDLAGAKTFYERALQIFREFLGDVHPSTKTAQNNLRLLEEDMKNAGDESAP